MYTGFYIKQNQLHGPKGTTGFYVHEDTIVMQRSKPSGFYLLEASIDSVQHIHGPRGYTRFYVQDGHIYGPKQTLPWLDETSSSPTNDWA